MIKFVYFTHLYLFPMAIGCRHCWRGHEAFARLSILEHVNVDAPVAVHSGNGAIYIYIYIFI